MEGGERGVINQLVLPVNKTDTEKSELPSPCHVLQPQMQRIPGNVVMQERVLPAAHIVRHATLHHLEVKLWCVRFSHLQK